MDAEYVNDIVTGYCGRFFESKVWTVDIRRTEKDVTKF